VDPGVNPDQKKRWMAKVNCSNNNFEQNLLGLQFKKQIFYRVIKPILSSARPVM